MTINKMKIKLFGKVCTLYRVLDQSGEVLYVAETAEEAQEWINNA